MCPRAGPRKGDLRAAGVQLTQVQGQKGGQKYPGASVSPVPPGPNGVQGLHLTQIHGQKWGPGGGRRDLENSWSLTVSSLIRAHEIGV